MFRFLLRLFLLLMTLVGIGVAFVMPWMAETQQAVETGRWRVYDRAAGFRDVTVDVSATGPTVLVLDFITEGPLPSNLRGALVAVTASREGRTVLAQAVDVAGVHPRMVAPQNADNIYTKAVAELGGEASGQLHFHFTSADAEIGRLLAIDMALQVKTFQPDPQLVPLGYVLVVVGFVGLVTSFRSRRPAERNEPPPPKWGRG